MQPEQQQRIMGYFIEEAKDHLNTIEQGLLNLQATIGDAEMANEVFRAAHSVKGGAAMLGLDSIQQTSHRMEDYFKILKESPVQVDRALETMFLQVFDALQDLLDQLQGPFGLTDDKAQEIMTNVEPVFGQISTHLDQLVAQGASAPLASPTAPPQVASPAATQRSGVAYSEQSALTLVFRSDVPGHLRDVLNLFKQADNASTRQQLQDLCDTLHRIGEQFELAPWCDLVKTVRLAITSPENSYRNLAPVVIKDLKKGQDLVVVGRSAEVAVSDALQAMLPEDVLELDAASDLDALLDEALDDSLEEPDLNDLFDATAEQVVEDLAFEDPGADISTDSSELGLDELDGLEASDAGDFDALFGEAGMATLDGEGISSDSHSSLKSGPEVGTAELNSLADLFEGEGADFSDAWQEETVTSDVTVSANDSMDVDITSDFSDLLLSDEADESASSTEEEDLADLFGDTLFDTPEDSAEANADSLDGLDIGADSDLIDLESSALEPLAAAPSETSAADLSEFDAATGEFDLEMAADDLADLEPPAVESPELEFPEDQPIRESESSDLDDLLAADPAVQSGSADVAEASDAEIDELFAIADQPLSPDDQGATPAADGLDDLLSTTDTDDVEGFVEDIPEAAALLEDKLGDPWEDDAAPEGGTGSLADLSEFDDLIAAAETPATAANDEVTNQPVDDALADLFASDTETEADLDLSDLEEPGVGSVDDFDLSVTGQADGIGTLDHDFDLGLDALDAAVEESAESSQELADLNFGDSGFDAQEASPEESLDFDLSSPEPQEAALEAGLDFGDLSTPEPTEVSEDNLDFDALIEGGETSQSDGELGLDDLAIPEDEQAEDIEVAETSDLEASLGFDLDMPELAAPSTVAAPNFDDLGFDDGTPIDKSDFDTNTENVAFDDLDLEEIVADGTSSPAVGDDFDLGGESVDDLALSGTPIPDSLLDELDLPESEALDLGTSDTDTALAAEANELDLSDLAPESAPNLDAALGSFDVVESSPETMVDRVTETVVQAETEDNFFDLESDSEISLAGGDDIDDFFNLAEAGSEATPEDLDFSDAEIGTAAEAISVSDDSLSADTLLSAGDVPAEDVDLDLALDDLSADDLASVDVEDTSAGDVDLDLSLDDVGPDDLASADVEDTPAADGDLDLSLDDLSGDDLASVDVEDTPTDGGDLDLGMDFNADDLASVEVEDAPAENSDLDLDLDDIGADDLAGDNLASVEIEDTPPAEGDLDLVMDLNTDDLASADSGAVASESADLGDVTFDDLDGLLDDDPGVTDLPLAVEDEVASTSEIASDNVGDADDGDAAGFDDLDALLEDGDRFAVAATAEADDFGGGDFDGLDALLEDDQSSDIVSGFPDDSDLGNSDDEFGDLERLLEEADQSLGGGQSASMRRTTTQSSRRTARRGSSGGLGDQNMRVSVKHLDNLSNLVGELVVNRNTLEQDQERLRQFLDNLLFQVQQLNDVGQRMRDLYERSLLESSLISSRQAYQMSGSSRNRPASIADADASHSTGATFDALEMDRFTGFHTLSQEMIELIVRVRESSSDIAYTIESSDQVTRQFRQVTTQLQEGLNKARMVPFAQTADRLPRAVRDISMKFGKEARLVVEGRDTLIDKMILEQLYDPMTHLVNNAITHGIETPAERLAAGKGQEGTITIRAFYQGNQTVIYVADDGAGINHNMVKRKAMQKGLITQQEARNMAVHEVYELLYHPGFSTRDQADDFAGRGVGMDVVRTYLAQIRGTITTDSEIGRGTSFTIRLPLTLSISKALSCVSNQARIAFPMDGVEDMLDVPQERVQVNDRGQSCILWRDTLLPFQPLSDLLTFNRTLGRGRVYGGNQDDEIISVVVLRSANTNIALQVDQVIGEQEIVIKQLEGPVPKPVGIAGATVLGDGRVMPIADVLELIDLSMGRVRREPSTSLWTQEEALLDEVAVPAKSEPTVLIVDDSITVRELLSMSFNKVGYRVEQARDGQEAWEKLRSGLPCDLVFCDIEMPRMDGLELLSRMQKDTGLSKIPIAMLTSRGADRHRQMAVDLGANGYFTKPYLEEALLDAAQRMLNGEMLVGKKTGTPDANGN
ncbi:MAG: response regulator [Cyanobacteria bacterium J06639_16]